MVGLQVGCVVGDPVVVVAAVVVSVGLVVTQVVPGTCHWPAESEQLSTWPLGERQSLVWELSQVPGR